MKVELFAICEGAFNHDGHLTIINTQDRLSVPVLPCRVSFGIALKLCVEPRESVNKKLSVSVLAPDQSKVFDPEVVSPIQISGSDVACRFALSVNIQNALFTNAGTHNVHLELDGSRFADFSFEVEEKRDA